VIGLAISDDLSLMSHFGTKSKTVKVWSALLTFNFSKPVVTNNSIVYIIKSLRLGISIGDVKAAISCDITEILSF